MRSRALSFVELLLHAKTEQIALYSEIAGLRDDYKDFAMEGKIEHKLIEVTLRKLVKHAESDDDFKACVSVIKDLLEHHAQEEEEDELFPKLRETIELSRRVEMGENMMKLKEKFRGDVERLVNDAITGMGTGTDRAQSGASAH